MPNKIGKQPTLLSVPYPRRPFKRGSGNAHIAFSTASTSCLPPFCLWCTVLDFDLCNLSGSVKYGFFIQQGIFEILLESICYSPLRLIKGLSKRLLTYSLNNRSTWSARRAGGRVDRRQLRVVDVGEAEERWRWPNPRLLHRKEGCECRQLGAREHRSVSFEYLQYHGSDRGSRVQFQGNRRQRGRGELTDRDEQEDQSQGPQRWRQSTQFVKNWISEIRSFQECEIHKFWQKNIFFKNTEHILKS